MLSLRYYLETMKNSLDVISKTYLINDNGEFYTANNDIIPSLLRRVNLYEIYNCIGKTVYVQYEGTQIQPNFKTYYQTKIVDIIKYQGNDYIKFNNNILVQNVEQKLYPPSSLYGEPNVNFNPFEFCYMRIFTIPLVMMFYSQ